MFIDSARIYIKAGNGGNGIVSFLREKYVPNGGPNGGDGGTGGSIIFVVGHGLRTLADFRYKRQYKADCGNDGESKNRSGKNGEDLYIKVPKGTIIKEQETGHTIVDMIEEGQEFVILKGGRGGAGNQHFATPTRQIPNFAKPGEKARELNVSLELKLLADVGLLGFPNVGKSTLLSMVSAAKPKIENYHFTTLTPNLGVVSIDEGESFVMADIPGIIEGAHEGVGLGHDFLRHIERTKILIHVIDIASVDGRDPIEDFEIINKELKAFNSKLASKLQIVATNKMDIPIDAEKLEKYTKYFEDKGHKVFPISAATNKGIKELINYAYQKLKEIPDTEIEPIEASMVKYKAEKDELFTVFKDNEVYVIAGDWIERIMHSTNIEDYESLQYFQRLIKSKGVIEELERIGISEGDTVRVNDTEFDFVL